MIQPAEVSGSSLGKSGLNGRGEATFTVQNAARARFTVSGVAVTWPAGHHEQGKLSGIALRVVLCRPRLRSPGKVFTAALKATGTRSRPGPFGINLSSERCRGGSFHPRLLWVRCR